MPFTDSERYQSRLFNFFHQQKRRWSEKIQRTARHVKVNANWSLEALLHSAVLMMRKVIESRGKRLKPGKNPDNSSVTPEYTEIQKQELIDTQGNLNPSLPSSAENEEIGIETQIVPSPKGAIAFFDTAIAKFESNALVPVSQASGGFLALIQTQFKIFVYGEQAANTAEKDQKNELQKLIVTALNFLFDRNQNNTGRLRINTIEEIPSTSLPSPKSSPPNLESQEIADPWLTLSDLFGDSQETTAEEEKAETSSDVPRTSKNPPQNWLKRYQQFLQQPQPDSELVNQQPPSVNITATTTAENDTSSLSELNTTNNQLETNPDFIDTQAKIVGYAQHPLERVLQWLDNGMLWLEEKIVTVFNFIQGLWRRK
ncbi:hypothetical protein [Calothrix rhizosoleniae]|uniref:hypothetical protein n=1 Tax=Calothrix rhizosoleniae TaxID=888997 RepID=UPI000B49CE4D|nr:hypothetical protein [Calothrix rhizosoleniae]